MRGAKSARLNRKGTKKSGNSNGTISTSDTPYKSSKHALSYAHSSMTNESIGSSGPKTTAQMICDRFSKQCVPPKK